MAEQEVELQSCPIAGFEQYILYSNGTVFSIKSGRYMNARLNHDGYLYVELFEKPKRKKGCIHRLLAEHFIPNPSSKLCVDHIDGCRTNNNLDNLRWATATENCQNRGIMKNNKSGEPGVYWFRQTKKWCVQLQGKTLGYFREYDDAVAFVRQKRQELYGEFARAN
jgi:hypothetical protein